MRDYALAVAVKIAERILTSAQTNPRALHLNREVLTVCRGIIHRAGINAALVQRIEAAIGTTG